MYIHLMLQQVNGPFYKKVLERTLFTLNMQKNIGIFVFKLFNSVL
jgi:hypothetical protein